MCRLSESHPPAQKKTPTKHTLKWEFKTCSQSLRYYNSIVLLLSWVPQGTIPQLCPPEVSGCGLTLEVRKTREFVIQGRYRNSAAARQLHLADWPSSLWKPEFKILKGEQLLLGPNMQNDPGLQRCECYFEST